MSRRMLGPKIGAGSAGALRCPVGRTTSVPDTTTVPGAAVVADGQVLPVRRQGGVSGRKILPDVARVVLARVEVDVVGDLERQVQRHLVEPVQVWLDAVAVHLVAEDLRQPVARRVQAGRPSAEERVEARRLPRGREVGPVPTSPASRPLGHGPGVEHVVADAHADPAAGVPAVQKTP